MVLIVQQARQAGQAGQARQARQAGPARQAELSKLATNVVIKELFCFLVLDDEELLLMILRVIDIIFLFAERLEEQRWAEIHDAFYEVDGPGMMLDLTENWENQAFSSVRDKFFSLLVDAAQ
jgi:hypothetical protein